MGGTSKSGSNTSQQSSTTQNPWADSMPALQGILGGLGSQVGNYAPTAAEAPALNTIQSNAQSAQNYGGQATGLSNDLMAGGGTGQNAGILGDAYANYQRQLNPIANQNNDPTQAPGMQALLASIRNDVGNSVNGMFAGAGRDMSGLNQQTLARGISQGEAAPLLNQYNQNVQNQMGAAGSLFGAGGSTAQGLQGFNQQGFANRAQGLDTAINGIPLAQNNQANQILQAGQIARGLPLQNLGMLEGLTIPLAGLGGTTNTTGMSNSQGTLTDSGMRQFQQFGSGMGGLFGGAGGGAAGNASGMLGNAFKFFSDRRTKDDVEKIGTLYDGTPVYRFRYKGDPRVTMGLMADDVEKFAPEAVAEFAGYKMVDYGAATERAAEMGAK